MFAASVSSRLSWLAGSSAADLVLAAGLLALVALAGGEARPAAASPVRPGMDGPLAPSFPLTCSATPVTHTRLVDFWYGSTFLVASAITDVTELSDHLTSTAAHAIYLSYSDPRVKNGLAPWITATVDMTWVLASPENLPAEASLRARLAGAPLPDSFDATRFDQPISHGILTYTLTTWDTDDGGCQVHHVGQAGVSYFELNARAVELVYLPLTRR